MLRFIKGFFITIGVLTSLIIVVGLAMAFKEEKAPAEPANVVLALDLSKKVAEQSEPSALDMALEEPSTPSLLDIIGVLDRAKDDPHVKGLMARFDSGDYSTAQAQEIRAALARFRAAGKFTYAFATSYGNFGQSNKDYYLASAFENIWLQPVGTVGLTGSMLQAPFGKDALDKLGVKADFMQREEYKSFMEMGQRNDFSPLVKEEMQILVNDLSGQVADGIAQSRGWKSEDVKALMVKGPYISSEALKLNLVTHMGYEDDMVDEAKKKAGDKAEQVTVEDYRDFDYGAKDNKAKEHAKVALIYGLGMIANNDEGAGGMTGDKVMSAAKISGAFNDAADDKDIEAILFRIDSPGGSPDASETIRHALDRAKEKGKKVIVSMGSVAASGGYWIAMDADHIVADPSTLTGSIGVVGGKFAVGELMQKLGLHMDTISTSENAGMWSVTDGFSPVQRERVNTMLDDAYSAFLHGVSDGRHIPMDKMPDIAKGRVWLGSQAVKNGLVDELGGYDVALAAVRQQLGLADDAQLELYEYPQPPTPTERILNFIKGFGAESAMVRTGYQSLSAVQKMVGTFGLSTNTNPISATMQHVTVK